MNTTTPLAPNVPTLQAAASGRRIVLRQAAEGERVEIVAPDGQLELAIRLTDSGPVLSLSAALLELKAAEQLRIECGQFEVRAAEGICIEAQEMRVRTTDDVHLNGAFIRLNCADSLPGAACEPPRA